MTNPSDLFGTNAALSGRTSVNAFNDIMHAFNGRGVLGGFNVSPYSGMTVEVSATERSVAIAEDNVGNLTSVNLMNVSAAPTITLAAAPATNSRIDAVVAYVDNPATATSTATDNPTTVGAIAVTGTVAATPSAPTDNQVRTAITADGASGATAYYVVLAYVAVANGTTTITSGNITLGAKATLQNASIGSGAILNGNLADGSITVGKIDGSNMYAEEILFEHVQSSDSASDVTLSIPIDFTNYRSIRFESIFEPIGTATAASISLLALDASNNTVATEQVGTEVWQGNGGAFINRQGVDIITAYPRASGCTRVTAKLLATDKLSNFPAYSAQSFSGSAGATMAHQSLNGRVMAAASSVKKLNFTLLSPQAGGWARVYGVKR